ncbi:MAG: bifunctional DNA-formamidopyrimidine glycosylase/DNA-(apurinic or apyrimidinic site) lyase [Candidatus Nanopelagicales bacterium]
MPELPEVETVRRGLAAHVTGQQIAVVEVLHPRAVRRHRAGAADFSARLTGRTMQTPCRRGKYLWLPLQQGDALVAHLGMSGQFRMASPKDTAEAHLRIRLGLQTGREVRFVDQRTFGGMAIEALNDDGVPEAIAHIGLDPFHENFDLDRAVGVLRGRRTEVKRALLDQTVVSGIGNIYADEALWRARLHFARATDQLTRKQARDVLSAATSVMNDALVDGGTSFDALFVNINGDSGYFERSLQVYGREGQACQRCGGLIRRVSFTNRSSYFCPRCQRAPRS